MMSTFTLETSGNPLNGKLRLSTSPMGALQPSCPQHEGSALELLVHDEEERTDSMTVSPCITHQHL